MRVAFGSNLREPFLKKQGQRPLTIYAVARDARLKSVKLSYKKLLSNSENTYNALRYKYFRYS